MTGGWGLADNGLIREEPGRLGYRPIIDAVTPFVACAKATRDARSAIAAGLRDPTVGRGHASGTDGAHRPIGLERLAEIERRTVVR
jgi:hypothetical protein